MSSAIMMMMFGLEGRCDSTSPAGDSCGKATQLLIRMKQTNFVKRLGFVMWLSEMTIDIAKEITQSHVFSLKTESNSTRKGKIAARAEMALGMNELSFISNSLPCAHHSQG